MGAAFDPEGLLVLLTPSLITIGLILTRLSGLFISSPFFSATQIPYQVKIVLLLFTSLLLFGGIGPQAHLDNLQILEFLLFVFTEFLIGVTVGIVLTMIFSGLELAKYLLNSSK